MRQIVSNQALVSNGGMQATETTECMKWVNVQYITVNSEIFARILFSRIALKDTFAT